MTGASRGKICKGGGESYKNSISGPGKVPPIV